ncbi:Zn(II)2Cys6 transcription factor [Aspergillus alliaceus]|uniref:Zn(II)2Cys6 transcription factor n=1 Tax=Petromyces alliaceus TaxID=209559 RepID=UPI0012A5263E|nr:fungal-specific transcription factor domain-containing protein [Aspergillus alliaceus]KAB8235122.1 fungal-specific transcription factor domain-containing protein [Aspergillus alliaceus]
MGRSHHGCTRCKRRRQKCSEEKPSCKRCQDAGALCNYAIVLKWEGRVPRRDEPKRAGNRSSKSLVSPTKSPTPPAEFQGINYLDPLSGLPYTHRMLLHHFVTKCSLVACHRHIRTQICDMIFPMILQIPSLMFATIARSALHLNTLRRPELVDFALEEDVSSFMAKSLQCLRQELQTADPKTRFSLLPTIRTLFICEIYSGKADNSWRIHMEGAKALIESTRTNISQENLESDAVHHWISIRWFESVQSLAALTQHIQHEEQWQRGPRPLLCDQGEQSGVLDLYSGYTIDLDAVFREIGAAAWERQQLDNMPNNGSQLLEMNLRNRAKWLEHSVRAMISRDSRMGPALAPDTSLSKEEATQFSVCNLAYQYSALIHIYRRVQKLPSSAANVQDCVRRILDTVIGILPVSELSPWVLLTTPIFTAGHEAMGEDRIKAKGLLVKLYEKLKIRNTLRSAHILEASWSGNLSEMINPTGNDHVLDFIPY